jgi:CDP-diglyceride synthetase
MERHRSLSSTAMFDAKEFCAKSLVVVGVVSCIPAVGSALVALLYCWILWPPSAMNASNYMACLSWLAFVGFGVFLVVKWGRFAREFDTSRGSAWLWIISAGYCGIVLLGLLAWGYYLHNARR